jgi:NAD(P)-dependent dehydrogenase (short-subunit alcohol dehydrogenase family)
VELAGKVVLITGGASGIGLATSKRLATEGAIMVVADIADEAGRAAAESVRGTYQHLDVTDPGAWADAVETVRGRHGRIDVAHLNAGIALHQPDPTAFTDGEYRRLMAVNVDGVVFGIRAVAPVMAASGGGAIIATASLGGLTPMPIDPLYALSKHAVVAYVRSVAPWLAERGITVNALCPGFTDTPIVPEEARQAIRDGFAVTLLAPEEVAEAVMRILADGGTGDAWFCQPGREPAPYAFRGVPGPGPVPRS